MRAFPSSQWHAPWYSDAAHEQPSMPWEVYRTLSPRGQLHCRYLALGPGEVGPERSGGLPEDPPSRDQARPWFESSFAAEPFRQTVARL